MLIGLQVPEALLPLVSTKKSESIPALFNRYLSTFLHVRTWYENDHFDDATAIRSIKHVRSLHKKIIKKLSKELSEEGTIDYPVRDGKLWFNQFDMVFTQCAFIGLLLWDPERCGINSKDDREDLLAIMYVWRCLGYFMGIKDEYNLFTDSDDYESSRYLCEIFLKKTFLPNQAPFAVLESDPSANHLGYKMAIDTATALAPMLPSPVPGNVIIRYWTTCFDEMGKNSIPTLDSFSDYFIYYSLVSGMKCMQYSWVRNLANTKIAKNIDYTAKNRKEIYNKYKVKYPEIKYTTDELKVTDFKEYQDFFTMVNDRVTG